MLNGVVLVRNEASNLPRCLESLKFCDEVIVVDDTSTDDSVKVAKKLGARVVFHPLADDYAQARNWAINQVKSGWILFVDADEVVTVPLEKEIKSMIKKIEYNGFFLPRRDYMWGKELKHGDVGHVQVLRLARKGAGQWTGRVHETWQIEGQVGRLKSHMNHYPHPTMDEFLRHINRYSTIRARELYENGIRSNLLQIIFYPILKFKYLYLVKLGFLDKTAGFVHAMTMVFYTFLVRGKLWLRFWR